MGVKGLWRLLLPIGRRVSVEVLEGKVLAIDASIWLTQFLKAMKDPDTGSIQPAAHLIGFFRRLAKLRFHGIRPILVFDGATPIIKLRELEQRRRRREQFAPNSEGAVQRLAKRLLIQEIKKVKQLQAPTNGGASAPGFNLPKEKKPQGTGTGTTAENGGVARSEDEVPKEKSEPGLEATSLEIARALQEDEWQQQRSDQIISGPSSRLLESSEEIARALQQDEWEDAQRYQQADTVEHNDWDAPIMQIDQQDDSEMKTKTTRRHLRDNDKFDIEYISSLEPHQRKDAIEDAKRRQRMRSRQEFMPVAGQPEDYSAVQLRNFLRSTQLNKEIVEMAKREADKKASEGTATASDPSRRVVFERFDDKREPKRRPLDKIIRKRHSSDESDSELEWEEGEDESESVVCPTLSHSKRLKGQVIADSSDDEANVRHRIVSDDKMIERKYFSKDAVTIPSSDESSIEGGVLKVPINRMNNTLHEKISQGGFLRESGGSCLTVQPAATVRRENEILEVEEARIVDRPRAKSPEATNLMGSSSFDRLSSAREVNIDLDEKRHNQSVIGGVDCDSNDDDDEDDNIEWEDGDRSGLDEGSDCSEKAPDGDDWAAEGEDEISQWKGFTKARGKDRDILRLPTSNRNMVAIQQAQSTAANLTNWAGRAFRRAIAEQEASLSKQLGGKLAKSNQDESSSAPDASFEAIDLERARTQPAEMSVNNGTDDDKNDSTVPGKEKVEIPTDEETQCSNDTKTKGSVSGLTMMDSCKSSNAEQGHISSPKGRKSIPSIHPNSFGTNAIDDLLEQKDQLDRDRKKHDPEMNMETMNDEMKAEIVSLIELFGIPYVEAPAEAEAQCVALEALGLVDGVVTEDSDAFVFGAKTVYKNMFDDQKFVEVYKADDAGQEMSLHRNQMVALAMLLGGDYTEGVRGVGIVNAMEILQAFSMAQGVKEGLKEFRKWLDGFDPSDITASNCSKAEGLTGLQKFHSTHKSARTRWECPKYFPAENVLNAYLNPVVDNSRDPFSWGVPDVDRLVEFCSRHIGWEASHTKRMLEPILQRQKSGMRQTRLDVFMNYSDNIQFADVRSKRLRSVLEGIQNEPGERGVRDSCKMPKTAAS